MFVFVLFVGAITLFYIWMKWQYSFWSRNKVRGPEPTLIVGNIGPTFTFSRHWGDVVADWYNDSEYSNEPYIGYYKMLMPAVLARDPDFIKDVLITEFNKFRDNDFNLSKKQDPLTATNPFFVRDEVWKENRRRILPAFAQTKMKAILPIMNTIGEHFSEFVKSYPPNTDFNAKDLCLRFTAENVVRSTFSIDPKCFNKENESDFLKAVKTLFAPSFLAGLKFLLLPILPVWALDYFPVPFVAPSVDRMFRDLVDTNKASRSGDCQSNDIFELLLQLQKKHNFDDTFLAGSSLSLFFEGTETSSTTLAYAIYELALNPHCQDEIREEINATRLKYDGQITYDGIQEMNYLDNVLHETLRKHPALMVMQKVCTQEYTLPKTSAQSKPVTIQPGTVVNIPVLGIHSDAKYYPNPDEFKPERFNENERRNRHMATFLGFGEGPRICPGMRFALLQTKIVLSHIVEHFQIKLSPNHKPIVSDPQALLSHPRDGILIRLEPR